MLDPSYGILPKRGRCILSYGKDKDKDKYKNTEKIQEKCVNVYKLTYPVSMICRLKYPLAHNTHCQREDIDKDRDRMLRIPNTCYIFEKQGVQGYQILLSEQ